MLNKHVCGSLELYPEKSLMLDVRQERVTVRLRGQNLTVKVQMITDMIPKIQNTQSAVDLTRNEPLWKSRKPAFPRFVRVDVHTGEFTKEWLKCCEYASHVDDEWLRVSKLSCIQTLVGERFIDKNVFCTRPFDPRDLEKKYLRGYDDLGILDDSSQLSSSLMKYSDGDIWEIEIPKVFKPAVIPGFGDSGPVDDNILRELGEYALREFAKDTTFRSKRDNFRNKYGRKLKEDDVFRKAIVAICLEATMVWHRDLKTAARQAGDEVFSKVESTGNPIEAFLPCRRYFEFWYGLSSPISQIQPNIVLAATPFRSFIQRLSYKRLRDFECDCFLNGLIYPRRDVIVAIYKNTLQYQLWLNASRSYDRTRSR